MRWNQATPRYCARFPLGSCSNATLSASHQASRSILRCRATILPARLRCKPRQLPHPDIVPTLSAGHRRRRRCHMSSSIHRGVEPTHRTGTKLRALMRRLFDVCSVQRGSTSNRLLRQVSSRSNPTQSCRQMSLSFVTVFCHVTSLDCILLGVDCPIMMARYACICKRLATRRESYYHRATSHRTTMGRFAFTYIGGRTNKLRHNYRQPSPCLEPYGVVIHNAIAESTRVCAPGHIPTYLINTWLGIIILVKEGEPRSRLNTATVRMSLKARIITVSSVDDRKINNKPSTACLAKSTPCPYSRRS